MLSGVILSQILGKDLYGQYSMVNSTVLLFTTFSELGISATLTRYVALYRNESQKAGNIIGTLSIVAYCLSIIMAIFLFISAEKVSILVCDSNALTKYFKITAFALLFSALSSIQQSILLGMEKYKKSATIELIRCFIFIILSAILSIKIGVEGAVYSLLITYILRFLMMFIENNNEYKKNNINLKFNFTNEIRSIIIKFTIPAFIANLFVIPVNWINNAILAKQVGFGEIAIFSVALQWLTIITYIPSQMGQVRPIYTDLYSKKEFRELKKLFTSLTLSSCTFVVPIVILAIIFGKFILSLYGQDYISGYMTFILMMVASLIITIQSQVGALLQAIGKMWTGFYLNFIWSILITGIFYLNSFLGSKGYALAYCISYGIHTILSYIILYYIIKREKLSEITN